MLKLISQTTRPQINLDGPEGNCFCLIGYTQNFGDQLNYPEEKTKSIIRQMMSGDYNHLIKIFEKYFGPFVDLVTKDERKFQELGGEENGNGLELSDEELKEFLKDSHSTFNL